LLCTVPDVKHMHGVTLNREENVVHIAATPIEQLPYFFWQMLILWSQRTACGELIQGIDGLNDFRKSSCSGLGCAATYPQIRCLNFGFGLRLNDDAIGHASCGMLWVARRRVKTSCAGVPSPRFMDANPFWMPSIASKRSKSSRSF
jgi:hypothetical protein